MKPLYLVLSICLSTMAMGRGHDGPGKGETKSNTRLHLEEARRNPGRPIAIGDGDGKKAELDLSFAQYLRKQMGGNHSKTSEATENLYAMGMKADRKGLQLSAIAELCFWATSDEERVRRSVDEHKVAELAIAFLLSSPDPSAPDYGKIVLMRACFFYADASYLKGKNLKGSTWMKESASGIRMLMNPHSTSFRQAMEHLSHSDEAELRNNALGALEVQKRLAEEMPKN